ncbi:fimbrial protein [Rosenbergiella nectarea]|uniref:fimbrial protein n=2 Tax=Rosenbergiella nectarea TaxID=988801 RepID=UPI001F4EF50C|nr:fimbrial protein [Rosenbergiella nectarea]
MRRSLSTLIDKRVSMYLRTITLWIFCCLFSFAAKGKTVNTEGGDITIKGRVIAQACEIDNADRNIDLERFVVQELASGSRRAVSFSIHLKNCDDSIYQHLTVVFTGNEVPNQADQIITVSESGDYDPGLGLMFTEDDDTPIRLNQPTKTHKINKETMELKYKATVVPTAGKTMMPGKFYATLNYMIDYL